MAAITSAPTPRWKGRISTSPSGGLQRSPWKRKHLEGASRRLVPNPTSSRWFHGILRRTVVSLESARRRVGPASAAGNRSRVGRWEERNAPDSGSRSMPPPASSAHQSACPRSRNSGRPHLLPRAARLLSDRSTKIVQRDGTSPGMRGSFSFLHGVLGPRIPLFLAFACPVTP
jgi:hypothetical protein